jgi:ABC-type lipoprotein export system ATPase subunit
MSPVPDKMPRRLKVIRVSGLFGVFDHRIELNEERITIIHGPNGFGKTAVLRLVAGFFERRYSMLCAVPFAFAEFELDDGSRIRVEQSYGDENRHSEKPFLRISFGENSWDWKNPEGSAQEMVRQLVADRIPWLHRVSGGVWFDEQSGESLNLDEVIDRYSDILPIAKSSDNAPKWLRAIQDAVQVYFIRANRLEFQPSTKRAQAGRAISSRDSPAVAKFSRELSERIQRVQADYAALSQSLDRSFPVRIMSVTSEDSYSLDDVKKKLSELDAQRKVLYDTGLLGQSLPGGETLPEPNEDQLSVLTVYIKDVNKKLAVFGHLRERIELFRELLNSRFLYKRVQIDQEKGLVFQTTAGQELPPTSLSTGEQHEVVILYQLLFEVQSDALVLIDEPEISLHVAWQKPFLSDLSKISSVTKVDFLVATHSPQIIGNRWDLTVELQGPPR